MTEPTILVGDKNLVTLPNGWAVHVFKKPEGLVDPKHPENYRVEWGRLFMRVPRWKEYHETFLNTPEEIEGLAHTVNSMPAWGRFCPYCDPDVPLSQRSNCDHSPMKFVRVKVDEQGKIIKEEQK